MLKQITNSSSSIPRWRELLCVTLLFLVLNVIVMNANPFRRQTIAPMELLSNYAGWSTHNFSSPPSHKERSDVVDQFLTQWISLKENIRNGQSGLWNPLPVTGVPGVFELSRGTLTPSFLAFLLIKEHWLGYYFANLIKLMLASIGLYLFLRHFVSDMSSIFGSFIFTFCGFNAAWFHVPAVLTSVLIPWVLWSTAGWFFYRRAQWFVAVALLTTLLIFGGFPAVAAYGLYGTMLLALFLMIKQSDSIKDAIVAGSVFALAVTLGFALAAIPIAFLAEQLAMVDLSYRKGGTYFRNIPRDFCLLYDAFIDNLPRAERTLFVGPVALVFAFLAVFRCSSPRKQFNRQALLAWYGISLFICAFIVTYGLLPYRVLRSLPGIGGSPWSRFSIVLCLAAAILAALGFDTANERIRKFKNKTRWLFIFCMFFFFGYQVYVQMNLFRIFNSVTIAEDFFPWTPTLSNVKSTLSPTQSVIADASFFYSGTLGAYGISEWFAHTFRTEDEKKLLRRLVDEPFRSPTSASFYGSSIRLNAELYSKFGIRYVLWNKNNQNILRFQPLTDNVPAPPLPDNRLVQNIRVNTTISVESIGILLATYNAKHSPSDVLVDIKTAQGELLARSHLDAAEITDNCNAVFKFKEAASLNPGDYHLSIYLKEAVKTGKLTAWYSTKPKNDGDYLIINDKIVRGSFIYSFYGKNITLKSENWLNNNWEDSNIVVTENLKTPRGAYFINTLEETAQISEESIQTIRPKPEKILVNYRGSLTGYVVVPIRLYPGWEVYINGKKEKLENYLHILPAVAVNGKADILFSYEPDFFIWGGSITLSGILFIVLICYFKVGMRNKYYL